MTHYLPLLQCLDMPVSMQIKRFGDPSCGRQHLEVSYSKSCIPTTCETLGIPMYDDSHDNNYSSNNIIGYNSNNSACTNSGVTNIGCEDVHEVEQNCSRYRGVTRRPDLQLNELRQGTHDKRLDPYSPLCMVPLPGHLVEPNFVRRRNERERERVRCVNEGYDKLKEHLPIENKERRISKVETLRRAIDYIRELQNLLNEVDGNCKNLSGVSQKATLTSKLRKTRCSSNRNDTCHTFYPGS